MSDEYITPTALCAERNCSRSKAALQPDKTFRIAGSGGTSRLRKLLRRLASLVAPVLFTIIFWNSQEADIS